MDEQMLQALKAAYQASPDNQQLLLVLVKALWEAHEGETAYFLLEDKNPATWPSGADRAIAARICLMMSDHQRALQFATDDEPGQMLLRARALHGIGKSDEALKVYRQAVSVNPALEDAQLEASLSAPAPANNNSNAGIDPDKLLAEANDDTDDLEINRLLQPQQSTVRFSDVGGHADIKEQIRKRIILPFQKPGLFERFKRKSGGGILLYGPPGCGKTLLARATAGECEAAFYNVSIADVLDMYIGESENRLRAIFDRARSTTPSVLFFDELEALAGKRQYTREATSSKLVSLFLTEMDGFAQNNTGVLVLGATNVPWAIDSAFRRPGRFDRMLFVPPPDIEARATILQILLAERPVDPEVVIPIIARKTSGFSGADLRNLVETAADEAIDETLASGTETVITAKHLESAMADVRPTTLDWLTSARNYARYANEAGHYDDVLKFLKKHGKE